MSVQKEAASGSKPTGKPAPKRGRPRAYQPAAALQQATLAFWRDGYAGTSLDTLSTAMGMNRPSLYAAFGDKHALYSTVVHNYIAGGRSAMQAALAPDRPLREGLMAVYDTALALYYPKEGQPRGCLLVSTTATEAVHDELLRAQLGEGLRSFDAEFQQRFALAIERGELPPGADAATLARLASAVVHTLALRSRAGDAREQLRATAQAAVALLCGEPPAAKSVRTSQGATKTVAGPARTPKGGGA